MATIVAVRSGNWSDTSHVTGPWPGNSTPTVKPTADDIVQTDEWIITIDEDIEVALLEATSTGFFVVPTAPELPARRTVTAETANSGAANGALKISNPTGKVDITGSQTGGVGNSAWAIYNNYGTIGDITGSQTGGAGGNAWAIYNNGGTMGGIDGDQTGGVGVNAYAIYNSDGTIGDIDGSLICGPSGLFPIYGPFKLVANSSNSIVVRKPDGDPWTLSNDYPAEADVKSGVEYNRGTMTGELAAGGNIGPVSIVIGGGGIRIS